MSPINAYFLKHRSGVGLAEGGGAEELAVSLGKEESCAPGASVGVGTSEKRELQSPPPVSAVKTCEDATSSSFPCPSVWDVIGMVTLWLWLLSTSSDSGIGA